MTTTAIRCPINFRWKKYLETKTSSLIQQHQQKKDNHSASENDQQFTLNQPQENKTRSRGTTRFRNPNKCRQKKLKGGSKILKNLGKRCSYNRCTNSYSPSERVVMNHTTSKILCKVDAKTIHEILNLLDSFPDNCESLNEPVLVEMYKNCKTKVRCQFLSSILKDGQSL